MENLNGKKYLIIHGFSSSSGSYFIPSISEKLESLEGTVISPNFPSPQAPILTDWIETAESHLQGTSEIEMIIAHSLGGLLALQLLSSGKITAKRALLIGSSFGPKDNADMNSFLTIPLNLEAIQNNIGKLYVAFSLDDPWTPSEYGLLKVKQLNAIGFVFSNLGHFELATLPEELESIILK